MAETQKKQVSSKDVARVAGVSQSMVSRAFTPGASVSEEKRELIYTVAARLNYKPNAIARSLVKNSTKIIGIVMDRFHSPFYTMVLSDFTRLAQKYGYAVLLLNVDNKNEVFDNFSIALQYQVEGLVVTSANLNSVLVESCMREKSTPIVFFNRYVDQENINAVYCDGNEGGRMVADYLFPHHDRFACIMGEITSSTSRDRSEGFATRLNELGVQECISTNAEFSYAAGYKAGAMLLDRKDRPDAIFCVSDVIALGAMDAARNLYGLKIPEDLAFVGFDDIPMARWHGYDLTTVVQPASEMADATVKLLLKLIDNRFRNPEKTKMKTELVVRSSTRDE